MLPMDGKANHGCSCCSLHWHCQCHQCLNTFLVDCCAILIFAMPSLCSKKEYKNNPNQPGRASWQGTLTGTQCNTSSINEAVHPIMRAYAKDTVMVSLNLNNNPTVIERVIRPTIYDAGCATRHSQPVCTHFGKNRY